MVIPIISSLIPFTIMAIAPVTATTKKPRIAIRPTVITSRSVAFGRNIRLYKSTETTAEAVFQHVSVADIVAASIAATNMPRIPGGRYRTAIAMYTPSCGFLRPPNPGINEGSGHTTEPINGISPKNRGPSANRMVVKKPSLSTDRSSRTL